MCGRYGLTLDQEALAVAFGVDRFVIEHHPRYNIAPSQEVPALVEGKRGRRVVGFRWGLVPYWAKEPKVGYRSINARSETVARRATFRDAWARPRRCLVLADGFYEWRKPRSGRGPKLPFWIYLKDRRPFGFAGLWERWNGADQPLFTCTILTTDANSLVAPIHDRMPVILADDQAWNAWVDPDIPSEDLVDLLSRHPSETMLTHPVSTYVNDPDNEGPACIEPLAEHPESNAGSGSA